jgi:glycosyltransferase involved in cell wall biosynthesis
MKKRLLILFTNRFPFHQGEEFIENEIPYLSAHFDKVLIISHSSGATIKKILPDNVMAEQCDLQPLKRTKYMIYFFTVFTAGFFYEILRMIFKYKITPTRQRVGLLMEYLVDGRRYKKAYMHLISRYRERDQQCLLYNYWMNQSSLGAVRVKKKVNSKVIIRAHRYDLYFEHQPANYIPCRKEIFNKADYICFIAEEGRRYFINKHDIRKKEKLVVYPLGVETNLPDDKRRGSKANMVSCSYINPAKRLSLLLEALQGMKDKELSWTHIGGGEHFDHFKDEVSRQLSGCAGVFVNLTGNLSNQEVRRLLREGGFKVFVNVSSSEGLPVSIMEAMATGIPVGAPDVGGVIAEALAFFLDMNEEMWKQFSVKAYETWKNQFSDDRNYGDFVTFLHTILQKC